LFAGAAAELVEAGGSLGATAKGETGEGAVLQAQAQAGLGTENTLQVTGDALGERPGQLVGQSLALLGEEFVEASLGGGAPGQTVVPGAAGVEPRLGGLQPGDRVAATVGAQATGAVG